MKNPKIKKFKINTYFCLKIFLLSSIILISCTKTKPQLKTDAEQSAKHADINKVISNLSQQISSTMLEQNKRKVAIVDFPLLTGQMTELGIFLSDKLTNSLFQYKDKFEVVERKQLDAVFKEINLTLTGIIDDKTALSIGKVLGADAIVIGTLTDLGNKVDINIHLLATEQAKVLAVGNDVLDKDEIIIKLLEKKSEIITKRVKSQIDKNDKRFIEFESLLSENFTTYTNKKNIAIVIESRKTESGFSPENAFYNLLRTEKNNIVINLFKEELFKTRGFFKEIYDGDTNFLKEANALNKIDNLILGTISYSFKKGTMYDTNIISCNIIFNYKVINKNGDIAKSDSITFTSAGFSEDNALNQGVKILAEKYSDRIFN